MWSYVPAPAIEDYPFYSLLGKNQKSQRSSKASPRNAKRVTARAGLTVFIVEDERLIAENLKFIIEDHDWNVVGIASSGEDAVREARKSKPDLILMDVRIQGEVDGVDAAILIQESLKQKPRILFLSAHSKEQFPHLEALLPDSFAYLKKPYTPEDLVASIEELVPEV